MTLTVEELKQELENWDDNDELVAFVEGAAWDIKGLYIYKDEDTGKKYPAIKVDIITHLP